MGIGHTTAVSQMDLFGSNRKRSTAGREDYYSLSTEDGETPSSHSNCIPLLRMAQSVYICIGIILFTLLRILPETEREGGDLQRKPHTPIQQIRDDEVLTYLCTGFSQNILTT